MPRLRQTIISQIYSALEDSGFSLRDFQVDLEGSEHLARIIFLPKSTYEFSIAEKDFAVRSIIDFTQRTPADIHLVTIESPGMYKIRDTKKQDSIEKCIKRIENWCENIKQDLAAEVPIVKELDEFEAELERRINETAGDVEEKFSKSEIESLNKKLDDLAEKFQELEQAKSITESELAEIKAELQKMKGTLSIYPKSTWYKTAGHKFLDVTSRILKTKEGRELLLSATKKLLGLDM